MSVSLAASHCFISRDLVVTTTTVQMTTTRQLDLLTLFWILGDISVSVPFLFVPYPTLLLLKYLDSLIFIN